MNKLTTATRLALGAIFLLFGLNGFLQFLPAPELPDAAGAFVGALAASGYFFVMLKAVEVLAAIALLANRFVPLALTVLAPVVINILAFHVALAGQSVMPLAMLAMGLYLAWAYRDSFAGVLQAKAHPTATRTTSAAPAAETEPPSLAAAA